MTALLPFFLNTLMLRAADPRNDRFFLPKVLSELPGDNTQGKLLPIEQDELEVGAIDGGGGATITQAFIDTWAQVIKKQVDQTNQEPIANPANPYAHLFLGGEQGKLKVEGLGNVGVVSGPEYDQISDGYRVALTLKFNKWDGSDNTPTYPQLRIATPYVMTQDLCIADKGSTVCNGVLSTHIRGRGSVDVVLMDAFLDLVMQVTAPREGGAFRGMHVDVVSLDLRGPTPGSLPQTDVQNVTIDETASPFALAFWESQIERVMTEPSTVATLMTMINTAMNDPATRASVAAEVTANTSNVLDDLFAPVQGAMAPSQPGPGVNPVDRFLFDRTRHALNNPASQLFLPAVLAQSDSPALSPLDVARIDLPDLSISKYLVFINNVLTGLHVLGLTNVKAAEQDLDMQGNKMHFRGTLGGWNPPPAIGGGKSIKAPPASGKATFQLTAKADGSVISGRLDLTVINVSLNGVVEAFGDSDGDLRLDITHLEFTSAKLSDSIKVSVNVDGGGFLQDPVNGAANSDQTLGDILRAINAQIAGDLPGISRDVTQYAKDAIASELK